MQELIHHAILTVLCFIQLVYPAFITMVGHLRSKSLHNFKMRLEESLHKGEGFAIAVRTCTKSCMLDFDSGCAGTSVQIQVFKL